MKIYHGGYSCITKPEIRISVNHKDFGQGFYCTELQTQAERWSMRFQPSIISVFQYTELCSEQSALDMLIFDEMTDEWLDFIADCRSGKPHEHDIVSGAMANDQVWNYVADYISGILTREQFWVLAQFKHPTHQIAFCTINALKCLHFVESYEVKL